MAINTALLHDEATDAVVDALKDLYKDSSPDPDAMRGFAEALAQIAVATAQHLIARAELDGSGNGIV
ncbi:MAG: hypothetical protein AAF184_14180 [Pseudomonadota bacterium]